MYDNKPWYQSTGIVGNLTGVISALGALFAALAALKGIELSQESQVLLATLVVTFGGNLVGLIGRLKAVQGIGKPLPTIELASYAGTLTSPFEGKLSELVDLLKTIFASSAAAPMRSQAFGAIVSPFGAYIAPDPAPPAPTSSQSAPDRAPAPADPDPAVASAPDVPPEGHPVGSTVDPAAQPPDPDPQPQQAPGGATS